MKKKDLAKLLEEVCNHPDCEDWLKEAIIEAFGERFLNITYSRVCFAYFLEATQDDLNAEVIG